MYALRFEWKYVDDLSTYQALFGTQLSTSNPKVNKTFPRNTILLRHTEHKYQCPDPHIRTSTMLPLMITAN